MEENLRNELREHAWKYFALHSDQRLRTFNFFLILAAVVLGGLLTYLKDANIPQFAAVGGFLLTFMSFIFWKLDCRNRELIRHSENALKTIEADLPEGMVADALKLFSQEERATNQLKAAQRLSWHPMTWWRVHYSYSACFGLVFLCFALLGLAIGFGVFFLPAPHPPPSVPLR